KANTTDSRLSTDELPMKGQAQLAQDGNTIKGSSIRYQIGQQKLVADSSKNERVTTILQPNQIEN
ncbi:LptA/OstA family protein, partial [Vibrio sp. 1249-1]|uniref:LptA/OstA family protein n=1 Tax=Vibrio sp. 1249-1 TaxID=3074547 RepID=UPI002963D394